MTFTLLGGDLRSVYLCRRLMQDGYTVQSYGLELSDVPQCCRCDSLTAALTNTDCVVLPIPTAEGNLLRAPYSCTPISLEAAAKALPKGIPVFGSKCPLPVTDLTAIEPMAIGNAALTAQCALLLMLQNTERSLIGRRVLILGGGRIGTLLGLKLKDLGARVTVASRREECQAWHKAMGMKAADIHCIHRLLAMQDMVINTVPSPILDRELLRLLQPHTLLLELASLPGGFDPMTAEALGLRTVMGRGLPGRDAPAGAADIIAETIYKELNL